MRSRPVAIGRVMELKPAPDVATTETSRSSQISSRSQQDPRSARQTLNVWQRLPKCLKFDEAHTPALFALSEHFTIASLILSSKAILDVPNVINAVFDRVDEGTVELGVWDRILRASRMLLIAGCSGCFLRLDQGRLKGANQVSYLLDVMKLLCPFCQRVNLENNSDNVQAEHSNRVFYFGWCGDCGLAERALEGP